MRNKAEQDILVETKVQQDFDREDDASDESEFDKRTAETDPESGDLKLGS
jgi:hypothetical protein